MSELNDFPEMLREFEIEQEKEALYANESCRFSDNDNERFRE
jgi:hypothetical protein